MPFALLKQSLYWHLTAVLHIVGYLLQPTTWWVLRLISLKSPEGGLMPENIADKVKRWLAQLTEIGLLLVALAIVAQILIGENVEFFGNVVGNLIAIINQLGDNGLVGLIAIAIILWLFAKRSPG